MTGAGKGKSMETTKSEVKAQRKGLGSVAYGVISVVCTFFTAEGIFSHGNLKTILNLASESNGQAIILAAAVGGAVIAYAMIAYAKSQPKAEQ
jgi:hypothetical protein